MACAVLFEIFDVARDPDRSLAVYRALNEQQAINRFLSDQAATASSFRKGQPLARFGQLVARRRTNQP